MNNSNFKILKNSGNNFYINWDKFLITNKIGGPFYVSSFLKQMSERGKSKLRDNDYYVKDLSFCVTKDGEIIGIVPLMLEHNNSYKYFSTNLGFNTFYGPLISNGVDINEKQKVRDFIFKEIDTMAYNNKVLKAIFAIDPFLYFSETEYFNYLHMYGFLDASINTRVIDLRNTLEEIKRNIRKSYVSLINKGLKKYNFKVMNFENAEFKLFKNYIDIHQKAAGFSTRSIETFNTQFEAIKKNFATLIFTFLDKKIIQINYFNHVNGYVFYSSNANNKDFDKLEAYSNHSSIYFAIQYFKKIKYNYFDIGFQRFSNQILENTVKKLIDISFFKRGFGGKNIPVFRGIKYYQKEYMKKDLNFNIQTYFNNQ